MKRMQLREKRTPSIKEPGYVYPRDTGDDSDDNDDDYIYNDTVEEYNNEGEIEEQYEEDDRTYSDLCDTTVDFDSDSSYLSDFEEGDDRLEWIEKKNMIRKKESWFNINDWYYSEKSGSYTRKLGDTFFEIYKTDCGRWSYKYSKDNSIKIMYDKIEELLGQCYLLMKKIILEELEITK